MALGIVALVGLTGKSSAPRPWARTVMASLPIVAVSGAASASGGWNLPIVLGMVLSVVLGMLASLVGPASLAAPFGNSLAPAWRILTVVVVAFVLACAVVGWATSIAAPLAGLSQNQLALVTTIAAVAAAAGGGARRGLASMGAVIVLALCALTVLGGVVGGAPSLIANPLIAVQHGPWEIALLLIPVVLGATNPALRQVRADGGSIITGTVITAVVMLLGLLALLAFNGGYLQLPSFGLSVVAGYVLFAPAPAGAVLALPIILAGVVSASALFRSALGSLPFLADESVKPTPWWRARWFAALLIGLAASAVAVTEPSVEAMTATAAILAVTGWVIRSRPSRGPEDQPAARTLAKTQA